MTASADPPGYAAALFALTNQIRSGRGLPELGASRCAQAAALERAADLAGRPLEHAPLQDVIAGCQPASGLAAENLSRSAVPADQVVNAWLASPAHANNLLSPQLVAAGVGCLADASGGGPQMLCSVVFLG